MAILVLGGAGYIGSHTVYSLLEVGRDVVVVDNLQTGFAQAVHPNARFYQVDIRDTEALSQVFDQEEIEGVIHFAASSQVGESMVDPLKYYDNNVGGTISLLKAMVNHGVNNLVFSSTAATYGEPDSVPIMESDRTEPTNCYGETKLTMEKMMAWVGRAHGLRSVALRYFNAAGAHESGLIGEAHGPETHLIPLILQVPNGQRESITVFGDDYPTPDGTCIRDYIHVTDLAEAHMLALDYLIDGGESNVFNLGSGTGFSVNEMVEVARAVTGDPIPVEIAPRRAGDPAQLIASAAKAKDTLGWKPRFDDVHSIVASAWKWHEGHPHGYEEA
ncbi:MAG: UDP-glucose 4-epimerase GalE [Ancrocorticia populi]|uniref:UDP-glucose 4-epimerase GalE n=1 Tax=Ancrocorticia populi TaxID=2175228 RepID=UPI003F90B3C1